MPFIISLPLLVSLSWLLLTYCRLLLPIPWFHIDWITQYSFCYCVKAVLHVGTLYFNSKYFFVSSFFFSSSPSAFFFFFSGDNMQPGVQVPGSFTFSRALLVLTVVWESPAFGNCISSLAHLSSCVFGLHMVYQRNLSSVTSLNVSSLLPLSLSLCSSS